MKKGDKVVICDGMNTGMIGIVGGHKGISVAVCFIQEKFAHDCDGMCPTGGTYEPEYALLTFTEGNEKALKLLISHLPNPLTPISR